MILHSAASVYSAFLQFSVRANQIACLDGNANGQCGDVGDIPYGYDAYGNLTSDGLRTYAYDAENRLVSVNDGANTTTYAYNGDGDRVSQAVNGITTTYVLDTATPLTMVLAETTGTETIYYLHGLDLVAQNDGTSTEYFGYDGLGSVRQVLDSAGEVLFAQVFDPYGNPYASAGVDRTSWGFTGEQTDGNGLVFLRARYYEPNLCRFLQIDPSRLDPHLYAYAGVNPVNLVDLSGLASGCPRGSCGPDITDWFMKQMRDHYRYGTRIANLRWLMVMRAQFPLTPIPRTLFNVALETPFREIVSEWTFPGTNIPIGDTPVPFAYSQDVIDALGMLEYGLYGLAVDYANVAYSSGSPECGAHGCDRLGTKGHKSVTLCDHCIDVSDMGNMMFGLGGAARGYSLPITYVSASMYNVLADWLPGSEKDLNGLIHAFFSPDGRGAITGWLIGTTYTFINRDLFCGVYSAGRLAGGNENAEEALQCSACSKSDSPDANNPSSLLTVSKRDASTIEELMRRLKPFGY